MIIKKKLTVLMIGTLAICLFFAFGFQIDASGVISKDGGTANVSLFEPLRVATDEANAALVASQLAADEANAALEALELIAADPAAALAAEQIKVDEALAILAAQTSGTFEAEAAQLALEEAQADQEALELIVANLTLVLETAQKAADEANAALVAAQEAVDEANAVYSGLINKANEELEALQLAADKANAALEEAILAGETQELIDQLQLEAEEANAALEEFEPGENRIRYTHIIMNSNNGGSFTGDNTEGNYSGVDGDTLPFTFESEDGFDLVWLRIGNTKFTSTEDISKYLYGTDKKNLTIHAHFKKDKDYSPEAAIEETGSEEEVEQVVENEDEKSNNGNGKDKEKSNNGKKNKNK